MPIEYEMKYLYQITTGAISRFSEECLSAYWFINIEKHVLNEMIESDFKSNFFTSYELAAMKELFNRGYWVKWSEEEGEPLLCRESCDEIENPDSKPIPSGAD